MVIPFLLLPESPFTCQRGPRQQAARLRSALPAEERASARRSIYSGVLSAVVVFRLHIYFYILHRHTWLLAVVEKQRGWRVGRMDAQSSKCRR